MDAAATIDQKLGREKHLTRQDLQKKLNEEVEKGIDPEALPFVKMQHASNEMLMGLTKSALKAVFSPKDTAIERVRAFLHAVYLAQDNGVNVPILVLDGVTPPRIYSQECLLNDLEELKDSKHPSKKKVLQLLLSCFFANEELDSGVPANSEIIARCIQIINPTNFPEKLRMM